MKPSQDKVFLTRTGDMADLDCLVFCFERAGAQLEGFVIKTGTEFRAYLNHCPHTGISLNWNTPDFFDVAKEYIQCCMHGALFQPLDGLCIYGPCINESLFALDIVIESERLYFLI